ncbi:hypothetical protein QRN89_32140 [Streptomyces chengbuensis]|uniref:hypothetical protein n=1 Tax=Streptomyces chengbuensis TaxID=3053466 RepID=UPI0025B41AFB|nr:hypothetical protein [Streptomyces sp. HUAS CB01]WJY54043.1 hypothetical protein QRN89_32140 [Streptomyces sp. HUAS CB01]
MTTVWWAILAAAAVSFSYKALGPALLGDRRLPEQAESVIALPAPSLLAGLVVAPTGPRWTDLDGTLPAGVAVAAGARLCGAPVPAAVLAGVLATPAQTPPLRPTDHWFRRPSVEAPGPTACRPRARRASTAARRTTSGRCRPRGVGVSTTKPPAYAGPGRRPRPGGMCPVPCAPLVAPLPSRRHTPRTGDLPGGRSASPDQGLRVAT